MEKSVFQILNEYDITEHLKKKDKIVYLPWSKAWMIVKSLFPSAKFTINKAADGCIYHTDGKTAWVEVSITINDQTETESLAVMDFRNKSIPIDTITSADAEKSIKRCLVKCAALHGLGLSLWTGEELSSAARKKKEEDLDDVKQEILSVVAGKLEAGVSKDTIYKAIESVAGVKNPNAIKDIATAQKVVEQIKKLELYECVMAMTGKSHTDPDGEPFALKVMQYMNDKCAAWKAAEDIDYSLYGTPIESTTYKFAKCLQKRFGVIEGITDKGYITNSYHVHVTEHINAFDKLRFESQFQKLSPGGAISYIEVANLSDNIPAVLTVLKYIYDNIMYAELNTKSDYCQVCGWDKEIEIVDDDRGKLIWKCPNCGNTDKSKMNIARRTCGYIGLNDWNQGRTQEIKERYVHLGGDE